MYISAKENYTIIDSLYKLEMLIILFTLYYANSNVCEENNTK